MTVLDEIVASKRCEIESLPAGEVTAHHLRERIAARGGLRPFRRALAHAPLGLIAEVKKASPSAGVIATDFDPSSIARDYRRGGAHCLSVLTDAPHFQGALAHLDTVRRAVDLPLLRKDFVLDPRQIVEAVEWGADAVLLIVSILDQGLLEALHRLAREAGLAVLVEVHDEEELDRALAVGADLIGVNNRDLRRFTVDLGTTERLARVLDRHPDRETILLVAESGIRSRADVERMRTAGAQALLVGESLMRRTGSAPERIAKLFS